MQLLKSRTGLVGGKNVVWVEEYSPRGTWPIPSPPFDPARGLVLRGTIVTMDDQHTVIENGSFLVRDDQIVALWRGENPPFGTPIGEAEIVDFGPTALIFPGMINLHDHPTFDVLRLWPAPSSDAQPTLGRPLGTEPHANRYQWNDMLGFSPPEAGTVGGKLNLERLTLTPLFTIDDEFFVDVLGDRINLRQGLLMIRRRHLSYIYQTRTSWRTESIPLRRRPLRIVGTNAINGNTVDAKVAPLSS